MSTTPLVSVMLPVYNGSRYLSAAIESLLCQTYKNIEVLISDNCSTDSTQRIVEQFMLQDQRIKYSRNETNLGTIANHNLCLAMAKGEYIELFGHDDILNPNCIEFLVNCLEANPGAAFATSATDFIDENGSVIATNRPYENSGIYSGDGFIRDCLKTFSDPIVSPVLFRSKFKERGLSSAFVVASDLDFWFFMLQKGDLGYVDEVLMKYRKHQSSYYANSMSKLNFATDWLRLCEHYSQYLPAIKDVADSQQNALEAHFTNNLLNYMNYYFNENSYNFDELLETISPKSDSSESSKEVCKTAADTEYDYLLKTAFFLIRRAVDLTNSCEKLKIENRELYHKIELLNGDLQGMRSSTSWKITKPLRKVVSELKRNS